MGKKPDTILRHKIKSRFGIHRLQFPTIGDPSLTISGCPHIFDVLKDDYIESEIRKDNPAIQDLYNEYKTAIKLIKD